VRIRPDARISELPGYAEGVWWVQDAGAALPARLLGAGPGQEVADLCAAPGGKTAQLAATGARITAVDLSPSRLVRVRENLARLQLEAELVEADVLSWSPGRTFDAVLLDAPCTSTGTIRRHPDILHLKRPDDVAKLAELQAALLDAAVRLIKPGGVLVCCVCSLEPEEGPEQIRGLLQRAPELTRAPIIPGEAGIAAEWLTPEGDLRTFPFHLASPEPRLSGIDGFYAARLVRLT
jgi:16S rRNA (cytosine967-C5)-methyltransferase